MSLPISEPEFPGIEATFVHQAGDWSVFNTCQGNLVREIRCRSVIPRSFFSECSLRGYLNGSITLTVSVNENLKNVAKHYFAEKGLNGYYDNEYIAFEPEERARLYAILAAHNRLPEGYSPLIRLLANAINWLEATPLTHVERLPLPPLGEAVIGRDNPR